MGRQSHWFLVTYRAVDGWLVNLMERVEADGWKQAEARRKLTEEQLFPLATAPGLDFPDAVNPPPAP